MLKQGELSTERQRKWPAQSWKRSTNDPSSSVSGRQRKNTQIIAVSSSCRPLKANLQTKPQSGTSAYAKWVSRRAEDIYSLKINAKAHKAGKCATKVREMGCSYWTVYCGVCWWHATLEQCVKSSEWMLTIFSNGLLVATVNICGTKTINQALSQC